MKFIRFIYLSLLALGLIACTGIFIFFQTFDTDQYLPQITQRASLALGRPVSIGKVGLGFSGHGITLDAGPVIVADDKAFTIQPFIKVDKVRLSLDLKLLIFQRKICITQILLESPQIHFIRSQEGNINARSIGQASYPTVIPASAFGEISPIQRIGGKAGIQNQEQLKQEDSAKRSNRGVFARNVTIKKERALFGNTTSIKIKDASISYIDQNQTFPLDIWLLNISANLKDFSLSKPFQLSFDASPLLLKGISPGMPDSPVFKNITGVAQINMAHLEFGASDGLTANGSLNTTGGVIKNFNIFKTVLSHTLGSFGGVEINIDHLLNGQLKSQLGAADTVIKKVDAKFSVHDKTVTIDDFLIETDIFEFTAKGSVDQGLNTDLQTMLHLNNAVSAALVNEFGGLKLLCDDSKRIAIGASLKGVIPHLKYKPNKDFRKKSTKALIEEGGNILGVLLGGTPASLQGQDSVLENSGKKVKNNFKNIFKSLQQ